MKPVVVLFVAGLIVLGIGQMSSSQYNYPSTPQPAQPAPSVQTQGGVRTELKTAITHAGFAGGGDALSSVQQHLGHTLNCIEGTKGKNFNRSWGHVCQGQGNGILVDLKAAHGGAEFMLVAGQADSLALAGVKSKDIAEARNAAKGVGALLTVVADNLK
jgi:hypothetical protein